MKSVNDDKRSISTDGLQACACDVMSMPERRTIQRGSDDLTTIRSG